LWRWSPNTPDAARVLVVPELGFDHRLVTPLCERLRANGFDVGVVEGRHLLGADSNLTAWHRDVARAMHAFGPSRILAIGLGGRAAFDVAEGAPELARGFVAVNVPFERTSSNLALVDALETSGFDPKAWLDGTHGAVLLASGRRTPRDVLQSL